MEELSFSAYYPTGKQDKQTEGYYKWLCLSAYMKIKELEQPQGEWVDTASGYKCSVCGEKNDYAYDEYKHKFTDYYCPNCGAKMKQD